MICLSNLVVITLKRKEREDKKIKNGAVKASSAFKPHCGETLP